MKDNFDTIKNLIAIGDTEGAIKLFEEKQSDSTVTTLFKARLSRATKFLSSGMIQINEYLTIWNSINAGLLYHIDEINGGSQKNQNKVAFEKYEDETQVSSLLDWFENRLWADLFVKKYFAEYYALEIKEQKKNPQSLFYKDESQMSLLFEMRLTCLEYAEKLEDLWITFKESEVERFLELYKETKSKYEKKIVLIDNQLILEENKNLEKLAERNTKKYFSEVYKIKI